MVKNAHHLERVSTQKEIREPINRNTKRIWKIMYLYIPFNYVSKL